MLPCILERIQKIVVIKAKLKMYESSRIQALQHGSLYTSAERYAESEHKEITSLAKDLLDKDDDLATVSNIYQWLGENLSYTGYQPQDLGVLYALRKLKGDCTEYMYLFAALARANGIPTRLMAGYVYDKSSLVKADDYHNWAEVYIDGKWRLVDPQKQVLMQQNQDYVAVRIISESVDKFYGSQRFSFSSKELKVKML